TIDRHGFHGFILSSAGVYALFEFPNGDNTHTPRVYLNDAGQIAGHYWGTDSAFHGFFRDTNGTLTVLPLAGTRTMVSDISSTGALIGNYDHAAISYLRRPDGTFLSPIMVPGLGIINGLSINQSGQIVGECSECGSVKGHHAIIITGIN